MDRYYSHHFLDETSGLREGIYLISGRAVVWAQFGCLQRLCSFYDILGIQDAEAFYIMLPIKGQGWELKLMQGRIKEWKLMCHVKINQSWLPRDMLYELF